MPHLNGAKQRGKHTTLIDLAAEVLKSIKTLPTIKGISPGYISTGIRRRNNVPTIKIIDEKACILVLAIQKDTKQEVRIYTDNPQEIKLALAKWTRDHRYMLRFQDREEN